MAIPTSSPTTQLPPLSAPQTPQNAPISIIPSRPMLTTPLRSENIPPIAPKTSGVAKAKVWASSDGVEDDVQVAHARARRE